MDVLSYVAETLKQSFEAKEVLNKKQVDNDIDKAVIKGQLYQLDTQISILEETKRRLETKFKGE